VSTSAAAAAAAAVAAAADVDRDTKDARSSSFRFDFSSRSNGGVRRRTTHSHGVRLAASAIAHSARSAYRARRDDDASRRSQ